MPIRGPGSSVSRSLQSILLFALGLWLGSSGIGVVAPEPPPPAIAERLSELSRDRDSYDTLVFGSSRLYRGLDPAVFDAEAARRGRAIRSFNLAFAGMQPHETNALLRRVLSDPPAQLRYVLIEIDDWSPEISEPLPNQRAQNAERYTARALAWHDSTEILSVLRSVWLSAQGAPERLDQALSHLSHWGARLLNVGTAARAARREVGGEPLPHPPPGRRGFTPYVRADYRRGFTGAFRRHFVESRDEYEANLEAMRRPERADVPLVAYNLAALEAQIATVRAAGLEAVYVLPPRGEPTPHLTALAAQGAIPTLLDFSRPDLHPELFAIAHRFDSQHVNPTGAAIFSRRLAEEFVRAVEAR